MHTMSANFGTRAGWFIVLMSIFVSGTNAQQPDPTRAGIDELLSAQTRGSLTCLDIATAVLARIEAADARLRVFITVNPRLMEEAARLDAERLTGALRPLHCVPIAIKDNFNTADLPTTGGSVLLATVVPPHDSVAVARLRAAGALIVGKTNMDEFAVAGSTISSIRGQTLNPYDQTRFAAGSSGGSAVAVATGMATVALGTETVNSLRNAASSAGVVGIRPTRGTVSRTGVLPLSSTMDVVGAFGRSVSDAVTVLGVLTGRDPFDPWTTGVEPYPSLGSGRLEPAELSGKRIGVLRALFGTGPEHAPVNTVMADTLERLSRAGAEIIDIDDTSFDSARSSAGMNVNNYEFKPLFERYLAELGPAAPIRTVKEYVNAGRYPATMKDYLANAVAWAAPLECNDYFEKLGNIVREREKLLGYFASQRLDALAYPMQKRPPLRVTEATRPERNGIFASALGFPAIDVPAGMTPQDADAPVGLPIGLDLLGPPQSDAALAALAMAVERIVAGSSTPLR
jgi:amidase